MTRSPSAVIGVLLAGGRGTRLGGGDKCLLQLAGKTLLERAVARLGPQVDGVVLNANGDPSRFAPCGLPVAADTVPGFAGPLAGFLAGLDFAVASRPGAGHVMTAPTDAPFFPEDLVARLREAAPDRVAVPRRAGRIHPVFALIPVGYREALALHLERSPSRKVLDWIASVDAAIVELPAEGPFDPFFNVNTPEDLAAAEAALAARLRDEGV